MVRKKDGAYQCQNSSKQLVSVVSSLFKRPASKNETQNVAKEIGVSIAQWVGLKRAQRNMWRSMKQPPSTMMSTVVLYSTARTVRRVMVAACRSVACRIERLPAHAADSGAHDKAMGTDRYCPTRCSRAEREAAPSVTSPRASGDGERN
jgi:hypothetical protein